MSDAPKQIQMKIEKAIEHVGYEVVEVLVVDDVFLAQTNLVRL